MVATAPLTLVVRDALKYNRRLRNFHDGCLPCFNAAANFAFVRRRSCNDGGGNGIILGIESSCDDTACAVLHGNERRVLGQSIISQQAEALSFGGIIPVVAKDLHESNIRVVIEDALREASMSVRDVEAIAVTTQPGLVMSLVVGINYAKQLSTQYQKSLIPIHHMEAHALVGRLVYPQDLSFPYLTLLISGGHCQIAIVSSIRKFILLGKSIDDAPGEAFDKIARRLKLFNVAKFRGLSGGAAFEMAARTGNASAFSFTEPLQQSLNCNFSFAGTKSRAGRIIVSEEQKYGTVGDDVLPNFDDICASFQYAIAKHLCTRLQRAIEFVNSKHILPPENRKLVVSGGVASNLYLSRAFRIVCQQLGYALHVPAPEYCTDNGVMIAWNGFEKYRENVDVISHHDIDRVVAEPICPLGEDATAEVLKAAIKCNWIELDSLLEADIGDDNNNKSKIQTA